MLEILRGIVFIVCRCSCKACGQGSHCNSSACNTQTRAL